MQSVVIGCPQKAVTNLNVIGSKTPLSMLIRLMKTCKKSRTLNTENTTHSISVNLDGKKGHPNLFGFTLHVI